MRLTRKRKTRHKLQVARHEAAHAVIAELVGHEVISVKLTRPGYGVCKVRHTCEDPMRLGMIALAGHAADMKWHRFGMWRRVSDSDLRMFRRLGFRDMSAVTVLNIARNLIDENADVVNSLARELLKRDLSGEEVREIMAGAP